LVEGNVELRQLRAFVTVATELHFGHAAEQLYLSPATLSGVIRRLEDELRTPLFIRTTRRVELTDAGAELLQRARVILGEVEVAEHAVRLIADGETGIVRLGITPPVGPILAPHFIKLFAADAPLIAVEVQRMWLPNLISELTAGKIDVAITCDVVAIPDEVTSEELCGEQLLVGLRPQHPLAHQQAVSLSDLANDVLGMNSERLFPAWVLSQRQVLRAANVSPPTVELNDTDLTASRWADQPEADWVLLISSLISGHTHTTIRPVTPIHKIPFTLHWIHSRVRAPAVPRFVRAALAAEPPLGWLPAPDHRS
jgi:DNA-binding transcriptional LysR family regulator